MKPQETPASSDLLQLSFGGNERRWSTRKRGAQTFEMGITQWLHVFLKSRQLAHYRQYHAKWTREPLLATFLPVFWKCYSIQIVVIPNSFRNPIK